MNALAKLRYDAGEAFLGRVTTEVRRRGLHEFNPQVLAPVLDVYLAGAWSCCVYTEGDEDGA
eukprot:46591-Eustigmatos_ZCMA.PRE.1